MIADWFDFAVNAVGGAFAFICVFEGTRRIRAYGAHRTAVLMAGFGAAFCLFYSGFSYWKHQVMKDVAQSFEHKVFREQLSTDWGRELPPDKREASSLAIARMSFVESGALRITLTQRDKISALHPTRKISKTTTLPLLPRRGSTMR